MRSLRIKRRVQKYCLLKESSELVSLCRIVRGELAFPADQSEAQRMSLAERAAKAAKIVEEPHLYKVCEGCDSIVTRRVATCPSCHGYRFNEDVAAVVLQAGVLGSREKTSVLSEDLL